MTIASAPTLRYIALVIGLALTVPTLAGTVAGTGGSTEITQLMNNVQLVQQGEQQIQTVRNTLASATSLQQQLQQMDPRRIAGMIGNPLHQIAQMANLDTQLGSLMDVEHAATAILTKTVSGAINAQLTPDQYLQSRATQAQQQGGIYAQEFNNDRQTMQSLQSQITMVQQTADAAPEVVGEVDGLQHLLVQNAQMQTQVISLNEAVTRSNTMAAMAGQKSAASDAQVVQSQQAQSAAFQQVEQQTVTLPNPASYAPGTASATGN